MYEFKTNGVCATRILFDIEDNKIHNVQFENGCNGNLKAIGSLVEGMDANDVVQKLKDIQCGFKRSSCGDQLARAIAAALEQKPAAV
ncbi:MAG: TIGR03905 family TSCPD domain-containing protein [Spirochaetaceae bacterium]|jgi:uncharacterized protein (TIGR03905 family)|nr:TIGR03905 family TSCPD domain-containing protein [Spirochaetaceae bacterium]